MHARSTVALIVAAAFLLSGCLGGSKRASPEQVAVTDTALAHGATNSLQGFVFTGDQVPIPDALVALEGFLETRISGAEGGFRFENLAAGEHTLLVTKDGWRQGKERATVRDGFASLVNVTLEPAPKAVHHETIPFAGTVTCHANVGDDAETGTTEDCGAFDPTGRPMHVFEVPGDAVQIQIEAFWTASTAGAKNLTMKVEDAGTSGIKFAHFAGPTGIKATVGETNLKKYFPGGGKMRVTIGSGPSARVSGVPAGVGVAFEQAFEVDYTVFYGEVGGPNFSYRS